MDNYSLFEKFLHQIALRWAGIRVATFDLDSLLSRSTSISDSTHDKHVFICGLPRSGTSILLHALHSTQLLTSITYRNMPFVLSPYLWGKISKPYGIDQNLAERAHEDGLMVNPDSPESFEEVFWLTFAADQYVRDDHLLFHDLDTDTQSKFRRYIANILSCSKRGVNKRYLSKNNNNILRLPAIRHAFPNASVIVPFRHPLNQAKSLLQQHTLFTELHARDQFARNYMGWLGHFEFGLDHRPFRISDATPFQTNHVPHSMEYWMGYWIYVYQHLLLHFADDVTFLNFENLCTSPVEVLGNLEKLLDMDSDVLASFAPQISNPMTTVPDVKVEPVLLTKAVSLYQQLLTKIAKIE